MKYIVLLQICWNKKLHDTKWQLYNTLLGLPKAPRLWDSQAEQGGSV